MQRASCKLGLILLLGILMVLGCGSSNEMGQRYTAVLEADDYSGEGGLHIDVAQMDCNFDALDPDWEEIGPAIANITVGVSDDAPGITLKNYTIQYFPLPSPDGTGDLVMPPELANPLPGYYSIDIPSGGVATFSITLMSVDTKDEYLWKAGWEWYSEAAEWTAAVDAISAQIDQKKSEIAAKNIEIAQKNAEIDQKNIQIAQATDPDTIAELQRQLAVLQIQLARLEAQRSSLEDEKTNLEAERAALLEGPVWQGWIYPPPRMARYDMRITLNFEDTYQKSRTIVIDRTLWLYNVDNC